MRTPLVGIALLCAACQTYTVIAVNGIARGNDVQLTLTEQGTAAVASFVGPRAVGVDGTVLTRDSTGILLAVREVRRLDGGSDFLHGEQLRVPADAVATAQLKRVDLVRSVALAAALGAGAVLVAQQGNGDAARVSSPGSSGNAK